jgi:hypothetical protein
MANLERRKPREMRKKRYKWRKQRKTKDQGGRQMYKSKQTA